MRIPEYPVATAPDTTDNLLLDGTAGTRIISVENFFNNAPKVSPPTIIASADEANWSSDGVGFVCWVSCPGLSITDDSDIILWDISTTATDDQAIQFLEAGIRLVSVEPDRIRIKAEFFRPTINIPLDVCNLFP